MSKSQVASDQPIDILVSTHQPDEASLKGYIIGFVGSIILTMTAYLLVRFDQLNQPIMVGILAILAFSQFILQLVFFLHLGKEFSPRLKLIVFLVMIMVVFILVGGSIWIMHNLDGRMFTVKYMERYMQQENIL